MALATLTIDINAKLANIEQDLGRVAHLAEQSSNRMSSAFNAAKSSMQAFAGALGIGLGANALVGFVQSSIDAMGALYDMSLATGASVESLSAMKTAAKLSKTSMDEVAASVRKFGLAVGEAKLKGGEKAKVFEALGIDVASIKDSGQGLFELAKTLDAMPDKFKAIALAKELAGKGVSMPFLQELAQQEALIARVTTQQALAAKQFEDDLIRLKGGAGQVGMALANAVLPTMNEILRFSLEVKKEWGLLAAIIAGIGGGSVLKALGMDLDPVKRSANDASDAFKKLADARKTLADAKENEGVGAAMIGPAVKMFRAYKVESATKAVAEAEADLKRALKRQDKVVAEAAAESAAFNRKPAGKDVADGALGTEKKDKADREGAYLSSLRNHLNAAQGDVSEYSKVLEATTNGSARDFSASTKRQALALATQADAFRETKKAAEDHAKVLEKVAADDERADKAAEDFAVKQRERMAGLQELNDAMGKSPEEAARLKMFKDINIEAERQVRIIEALRGGTEDGDRRIAEVHAAAAQAMRELGEQLDANKTKQDALNASWEHGAAESLRNYVREVSNVAAATEAAVTRAFRGMEDALIEFTNTGKLDFKSMANSIINDITRIQIQQNITKPLAEAIGGSGGFGSLWDSAKSLFGFGGGRAAGGPVNPGQYYVVGENGPEILLPNSAGTVIPNGAGGGGGQTANITFNVSAIDAQSFRSAMATNKAVVVGIVREAFTKRALTSPI